MGKIHNTRKFTNRVLEHANAAEFLAMKKLISNQFINLINTTPKCDINYSLTFDAKVDKFEQLVQDTFGKFRTESTPPSPKESTPPPTLPGMPPSMINSRSGGMNCSNSSQSRMTGSVTASSPISLPTSMQSSFDGDLSVLGNGFMISNVLGPDSPPQNRPPPQRLQHNLQQQLNNSICSSQSGVGVGVGGGGVGVNGYHHSISSISSGSASGIVGGGGATATAVSNGALNNGLSNLLHAPMINGLNSISGGGGGVGSNLDAIANVVGGGGGAGGVGIGGPNNLNGSLNSHLSHGSGNAGGLGNLSNSQAMNGLNTTSSSAGSYHPGVLSTSMNNNNSNSIVGGLNGHHLGSGSVGVGVGGNGGLCNGGTGSTGGGGIVGNAGLSVSNGGAPGGYNSMLEYNLSRLASLSEATSEPSLNDVLIGPPTHLSGGGNQSLVSTSNSQNQHITLADLLSGDQRALNNLQALAKMGLNNNGKRERKRSVCYMKRY